MILASWGLAVLCGERRAVTVRILSQVSARSWLIDRFFMPLSYRNQSRHIAPAPLVFGRDSTYPQTSTDALLGVHIDPVAHLFSYGGPPLTNKPRVASTGSHWMRDLK